MASGAFPIVSSIRTNRDWIDPGFGFLFYYDAPEELLHRILDYVKGNYERSYADYNRQKVLEKGSLDAASKKLQACFIELIQT